MKGGRRGCSRAASARPTDRNPLRTRRHDAATIHRQVEKDRLQYRESLENPPLLVVCDLNRFEIHTNFTGTIKTVRSFDLDGLADPKNILLARQAFTNRSVPITTRCRSESDIWSLLGMKSTDLAL